MDALLHFRSNHQTALTLMHELHRRGIVCQIPSHAYFEYVVTCITHFKHEPDKLSEIDRTAVPNIEFRVVTLDHAYSDHLWKGLLEAGIPDLKSQDLIYFCIARDRDTTLITEDKKLLAVARKGGIEALTAREALDAIAGHKTESAGS